MKAIYLFLALLFAGATYAVADIIELQNEAAEVKNIKVLDQQLIVSGQPWGDELQSLAKQGVKTVINLRSDYEMEDYNEQKVVQAAGMKYIHLPISGANDVNAENAAKLSELIGQQDGIVLVHCSSSNRVGALLALAKMQQGESLENALFYGKQAGLSNLKQRVESLSQLY